MAVMDNCVLASLLRLRVRVWVMITWWGYWSMVEGGTGGRGREGGERGLVRVGRVVGGLMGVVGLRVSVWVMITWWGY